MTDHVVQLIETLYIGGAISAEELAKSLGISTRAIRSVVHEANEELYGIAKIESRHSQRYELEVENASKLNILISARKQNRGMPSTPEERQTYLLVNLISRTDWVTLDKLGGALFVSRRTLSNDLKKVRETLTRFGLDLKNRPHHGIRVTGDEVSRRDCLTAAITESVVGRPVAVAAEATGIASLVGAVRDCVDTAIAGESFKIDMAAYQGLVVHIAIAIVRIRDGQYIPMSDDQLARIEASPEAKVAEDICKRIDETFSLQLPREETAYIALHLAGRRSTFDAAASGSLIISDEAWSIVAKMLEYVQRLFGFDFRDDIELHMNLARHIMPLAVRLRNHMNVKNPLLGDIRERFPLSWTIAYAVSEEVLVSDYGVMPSDDEVGYIALSFALAFERKKSGPVRKNILVVCATGAGSARLLEYRFREAFGDQLGSITVCDVLDVPAHDFSKIDYVFTTVPLGVNVPVPVHETSLFLDYGDIDDIRALLNSDTTINTGQYFDERLFFPHLNFNDKKEVLDFLCEKVVETDQVSPKLRSSVGAREKLAPSAFGNYVAMPHPMVMMGKRTVICVGILDHPVGWNNHEVRAVFMPILAEDSQKKVEELFEVLSRLFMEKRAIRRLVDQQEFGFLISLLNER